MSPPPSSQHACVVHGSSCYSIPAAGPHDDPNLTAHLAPAAPSCLRTHQHKQRRPTTTLAPQLDPPEALGNQEDEEERKLLVQAAERRANRHSAFVHRQEARQTLEKKAAATEAAANVERRAKASLKNAKKLPMVSSHDVQDSCSHSALRFSPCCFCFRKS